MDTLSPIHFTHRYLLQPTNPVLVNIIGAGGTGSQAVSALARMNESLIALGHPGLSVHLIDDDVVTKANLGRQLFADAELGLPKAVALINRLNRFFGTNWKAVTQRYSANTLHKIPGKGAANITVSCVDTVAARFEIATILSELGHSRKNDVARPMYWADFGNSRYTGQVLLSTIGEVEQPKSKKFFPVGHLPFITEQYKDLLEQATTDDGPSCSLAEALEKQDLFINPSLANMGASLLWNLFREGMTENRGFFLNLKDFRSQPIKVELPT